MLSSVQAAKPLWTLVPQTPTDITLVKGGSAQVIYTVQNHSSRAKTLVMKPIAGISLATPCQLPAKGSCTLTLNVNGATLQGDVIGGPALCLQGNALQCYQPSSTNILRIRLTPQPPVQQFTVTPSAVANGSISPATAQLVDVGSSLTFTATPNANFGVNQWLLDGNVAQNGGTTFQLNDIQANHTVEVTFNQATLTPLTLNLALSISNPGATPALPGNARVIRIENTGSISANNVQVSTSGFPAGTSITGDACTGTLNAGSFCDITITPGGTASPNNSAIACTTSPGTAPEPTVVTISADNLPSTNVNVVVLGYGCIYQGGFLFSIDDATPNTQSIGGKVAALTDEPGTLKWSTNTSDTGADSLTDGLSNTNAIANPAGQYPAAQACINKNDQGFTDWYLPAMCEMSRYVGLGADYGCGNTTPNLYSMLRTNNIGGFLHQYYWSSTEQPSNPVSGALDARLTDSAQSNLLKTSSLLVRCVRAFSP